jgi:hypothetical protein
MKNLHLKTRTALLTVLLTIGTALVGWTQIVAWEAAGQAGNEVTFNATTNDPNLNTAVLSRGAGISPAGLANAFSSQNFTLNGDEADAIANNDYLEFQISAVAGYKFSLATLDANFRRSSTGPNAFRWRYSTNGTDFFEASGVISYTGTTTNGNAQAQIDLSGIAALQDVPSGTTVTLRLYGWGASATTGTFAIGRLSGDDLAIGGVVELIDPDAPLLAATPTTLIDLNYVEGSGPSITQSFAVSGSSLEPIAGDINVAAPTNFEVSLNDTDFFDDVDIAYTDGEFTDETVYVRLKAGLVVDTYNGNISITGGGADAIQVEVSGVVAPFIPPYDGVGVFELITSLAELEDGYYVVANETSEFLMTNIHNTSTSNDYFERASLILDVNNNVVNPDVNNVWYIEANGSGYTIYNNIIEKYVGWQSGNSASSETIVTNNARWTFVYQDDKFTVNNVAESVRQLSYNSGSPRFAAYGNSGQQELQLYKYTIPTDPVLTAAPLALTNLSYTEGEGPSVAQALEISGINMDGTDVTISLPMSSDFELAATEAGAYSDEVVLPEFDGDAANVFVRLKAGLTLGDYNDVITISGGGATDITVNSTGRVSPDYDGMETFENFPVSGGSYASGNFTGVYGNTWNYVNARGDIQITDETITLQNNLSASLNSTITGGISAFSFDYKQAFATNVNLELYINGDLEVTVTSDNEQGIIKNSGIVVLDTPVGGTFFIEFKQGTGGGQVAVDNFNWKGVTPTADYTWEDGAWLPQTPIGNATDTDDILIVNGTATFDGDIEMNNLYVQNGATLHIENILTVNGNIENNGSIVFVSSSVANTAQFDTFTGTITGNGTVTTERFIPARRAFRFMSSSVTTSGSIRDNWQEGQNNPDTNTNLNSNPGFGTHITGSNTGANGFDATVSGNPSLFGFDNNTQSWTTIANTNVNILSAGTPYRLFVRGDRSVDVTSNSASPTDTRLRTTGQLFTGTYSNSSMGETQDDFNFIGNPYQAAIDMQAVLAASINLNTAAYLVWDPTVSERGAYVAVDLLDGGNNNLDSDADEYLQPGQAAFVTTLANGTATFVVQEIHKSVDQSGVAVFNVLSKVDLRLYSEEALAQNGKAADGVRIKFKADANNAVDNFDIPKLGNLDENLATFNDGNYLSIETRNLPTNDDVIPLFTNQYRHNNYVFIADVQELNNVEVWLRDHHTQTEVLLPNNQISEIPFQVDPDDASGSATDRFELFFVEVEMGTTEHFTSNFVLYPNPSNGNFYLQTQQLQGVNVTVSIANPTGQQLLQHLIQVPDNGRIEIQTPELRNGIYFVNLLTPSGDSFTAKWIKQ